MAFRKRLKGAKNRRDFRRKYNKVVAKNSKGLSMMRGGGYL